MNRTIAVRPAAYGWSLRIDAQEGILVFATGAVAETTARRLAQRLARAGEVTDILIYLRDGSLAGRLRSTPQHPAARARHGPVLGLEPAAA
jgi:hypothetical protein